MNINYDALFDLQKQLIFTIFWGFFFVIIATLILFLHHMFSFCSCKLLFATAWQFFLKLRKCSELGPPPLIRNTLTNKKKGAKRPSKIKILGRFAPGAERQDTKCNDSEKKLKKISTNRMLKY